MKVITKENIFWEKLYSKVKNMEPKIDKDISYFKIKDFEDYDMWVAPLWNDPDIFKK
jgi:hypothetical protein